jgi:ribosome biogenesis GTPase A
MTKTVRMLREQLSLVDLVIELLDARIPLASKNPDIDALAKGKRRIVILNKADLADQAANLCWEEYFSSLGYGVLVTDSRDRQSAARLIKLAQDALKDKIEKQQARGRKDASVRAMAVGIPNVGKSTLINALAGRQSAAAADRPGVTRGRQWIKVRPGFDMLDTPGILWPKFEDPQVGVKLAVTGAVSDTILDKVTLAAALLDMLAVIKPEAVTGRYKVEPRGETTSTSAVTQIEQGDKAVPLTGLALLEAIGQARGFKMKGGIVDTERAAIMVLDEFRGGKLGRITLELPS